MFQIRMFQKAVIVGCGLIGGSLALAMREHGCVERLVAVDPDPECREQAVELGVVDAAFASLSEAVADADLILFATPVRVTVQLFRELATLPLLKDCIITDVGGTKQEICTEARRLLPAFVHFIGGHPMAGSEKSGVQAASGRLFENAIYVLTPDDSTDPNALLRLTDLVTAVRAQVLQLDPSVHDSVVAAISHVPHIVAAMLVDQVADLTATEQHGHLYTQLAAGGFRDVTRIASGNAVLWRDVLLSNREAIGSLLRGWQKGIDQMIRAMEQEDGSSLQNFFLKAAQFRDALPAKSRGAIRPLYEISLDVLDEPGVIGRIATLIGMHNINLNDVRLIESREDLNGQLLLSFRSKRDMEAGAHVLRINGFKVYFRE